MKRGRKPKYKKRVTVTISLDEHTRDRLNKHRWYQSKQEGKNISMSEFINRMIDTCCPDDQMNMEF